MLIINTEETELFNDDGLEFTKIKPHTLQLEHSLISVHKWEARWHKPFMGKDNKSDEEVIDYIRCMTMSSNVDPNVYGVLGKNNIEKIREYIDDSMTATWFSEKSNKSHAEEVITAELLYYSMIALQIPFECRKWHLNQLITLIRVCNDKNTPSKKMSKRDILARNAALNAKRRAALNSKG